VLFVSFVVKIGLRLAAQRLRENLAAGKCGSKNKTFQESSANRFFLRALRVNKFRNEALVRTFLNADLIFAVDFKVPARLSFGR
jgi:hypothetical protein